eukprot:scaffold23281_cov120-Isochrysis_galbana.AAC.7
MAASGSTSSSTGATTAGAPPDPAPAPAPGSVGLPPGCKTIGICLAPAPLGRTGGSAPLDPTGRLSRSVPSSGAAAGRATSCMPDVDVGAAGMGCRLRSRESQSRKGADVIWASADLRRHTSRTSSHSMCSRPAWAA